MILLFVFSFYTSFSQKSNYSTRVNKKDLTHEIFVSVSAVGMNPLDIQALAKPLLESKKTWVAVSEIGYYQKINKNWGLKIGAGRNNIQYNTSFSFFADTGSPLEGDFTFGLTNLYLVNYDLFLLVRKSVSLNQKLSVHLELGIQYNYLGQSSVTSRSILSYYSDSGDSLIELFRFKINHKANQNSIFGLKSNVNLNYRIGTRHNIFWGFTIQYSPAVIAEGEYRFSNIPWESYGTADLRMNYIGLQIGYAYSF